MDLIEGLLRVYGKYEHKTFSIDHVLFSHGGILFLTGGIEDVEKG